MCRTRKKVPLLSVPHSTRQNRPAPACLCTSTKAWIINEKPSDEVTSNTFKLVSQPLRELNDGEILVKVNYFSNDPAQRTWIDTSVVKDRAYGPCPDEGEAMPSGILGKVIATKSDKFAESVLVTGFASWSQHVILSERAVQPARQVKGLPDSAAISVLGLTTLTAYCGLHNVGHIKPEHTVVISGAAGATGSAAVQIAKKIVGCKNVIGIAGGPEKCAWVKKLGADECLDYRSKSFSEDLIKASEGYVDIYFDNVGGEILNLMFVRMARFSRIIACGAISSYNHSGPVNLKNHFDIIAMRITMQGFIVLDFADSFGEAIDAVSEAIEDGKFIAEGTEHKVEASFEEVPRTWQLLFSGGNQVQGKLVTALKA
ncbi:hypothetical protein JCM11641_007548 [Rhodosporidiobolus odoratus]